MPKTLRNTIKNTVQLHLLNNDGVAMGQCLTAVGWVGGTLPELYEENNEIPNIYNNLLTEKAKPKKANHRNRKQRTSTAKRR